MSLALTKGVYVYTPGFEEFVGDESVFFDEYFSQKPMLRRKAMKNDPRNVLSAESLDELLHREPIRLPYLKVVKDGVTVPGPFYRRIIRIQNDTLSDCVAPGRVYEHFQAGATIQFNSINHFMPNLRELTGKFAEKFAACADIIVFLAPAWAHDIGLHHDPTDLFIIQLEGAKSWKLWARPQTRRPANEGFDHGQFGKPALEFSLEPGDVLYIPYNTPHLVSAQNSMSLHLSVTVRPRMWNELLVSMIEAIVNDDPMFLEFPYLSEASLDAQALVLKHHIGALLERLMSINPGEWVRRLAEDGRRIEGVRPSGHQFKDSARIDQASAATIVKRGAATLSFGETIDGEATIAIKTTHETRVNRKIMPSAKSTTIKVPGEVAASLRRMGDSGELQAGELFPGAPCEVSIEMVKRLARMDILQLSK
jgi:hypothetical protein